jgi:hypothetical protein
MKTKTSLLITILLFISTLLAYSQLTYTQLAYQDDVKSQYFTYNQTTKEYEIKYGGKNGSVIKHSNRGGQFKPIEGISAAYIEFEDDWEGGTFKEYGFLDSNNKIIIPLKYKRVENFRNGVTLATIDGKNFELIDKAGEQVKAFTAENAFTLGANYIVVKKDKQFSLIDRSGKFVSVSKYEDISAPSSLSNLVRVKYQNKYGFIDGSWQEVIPLIYQNAEHFKDGFAGVSTEYEKWGFINETGKVVVPCQYQNVDSFYEGLATVQQDELWGYIDTTGKVVIPIKFLDASYFNNGKAPVRSTDNVNYIINRNGDRIN